MSLLNFALWLIGSIYYLPFSNRTSQKIDTLSLYSACKSLIAQLVKNPPAMQESPVQFLGWKDPLEKG